MLKKLRFQTLTKVKSLLRNSLRLGMIGALVSFVPACGGRASEATGRNYDDSVGVGSSSGGAQTGSGLGSGSGGVPGSVLTTGGWSGEPVPGSGGRPSEGAGGEGHGDAGGGDATGGAEMGTGGVFVGGTGGVPGAGGGAPFQPGETRCETVVEAETSNGCRHELICDTGVVEVEPGQVGVVRDHTEARCARAGSEIPFECQCGEVGSTKYNAYADQSGAACSAMTRYCRGELEPAFAQAEIWVGDSSESTMDSCELYQSREDIWQVTDEVQFFVTDIRYARCDTDGETGSSCYCSDEEELFSFSVPSDPTLETCQAAILNCDEGAAIVAQGDAECVRTSESSGETYCRSRASCTQDVSVDGRAIVGEGSMSVWCRISEEEQSWWCSCASGQDTAIFEFGPSPLESSEICEQAPTLCLDSLPVFIGPRADEAPTPDLLP